MGSVGLWDHLHELCLIPSLVHTHRNTLYTRVGTLMPCRCKLSLEEWTFLRGGIMRVQNHGRRHLLSESFSVSYNALDGPIRNKMAAKCVLSNIQASSCRCRWSIKKKCCFDLWDFPTPGLLHRNSHLRKPPFDFSERFVIRWVGLHPGPTPVNSILLVV